MAHWNREDWWFLGGWSPSQVIAHLNPQVLKEEKTDWGGSLLIATSKGEKAYELWLDYTVDSTGEYSFEWNQFCFTTTDEDELFRMDLQESQEVWDAFTAAAYDYLP